LRFRLSRHDEAISDLNQALVLNQARLSRIPIDEVDLRRGARITSHLRTRSWAGVSATRKEGGPDPRSEQINENEFKDTRDIEDSGF